MSAPTSTPITGGVIVLAIIVLIMVRRTYALSQGTPYSPTRVFSYGAFSTVVFAVLAASTIYVAVGTWGLVGLALVAPYALVVVLAASVAEPRVRRLVRFEDQPDGRLFYRLPLVIPVLTMVLFLVRVAVEILLFGLTAFLTFSFPTSLPFGALLVLIAVDLLYGGSIGLLYGRAFAVRAAFRERAEARPLPQT
jgi:hypothetical protein